MSEISVSSVLNPSNDELPYAYFHPGLDGKLTWFCGEDTDGKITSVFRMEGEENRKVDYVDNVKKARDIRQTLIDDGWLKLTPPSVTISTPDGRDISKLSRKEKRALDRQLKRMAKQNPFTD